MSERFMTTIFCDDVRPETGSKLSYMGVYRDSLFVGQFPAPLAKLCFVMHAFTSPSKPFKQLKFRLLKDDEVIAEAEIDTEQLNSKQLPTEETGGTKEECRLGVHAVLQLLGPQLTGPCRFSARALTENGRPSLLGSRENPPLRTPMPKP